MAWVLEQVQVQVHVQVQEQCLEMLSESMVKVAREDQ